MLYILFYLLKPLVWLFMRPRIYGNKAALATKGKVIFICNHISMGDPVIIGLICPRIIHFMAKKEIFHSPVAKLFFDALYVFSIDRGIPDIKSIKKALKLLDKGKAFGIFPEGRRAVANCMDEFELGTALIAIRSGAPVVPLYIHNETYRKWKPMIMVGDPIYAKDTAMKVSRRENEVLFMQRMSNAVKELKQRMDLLCC